MGYPMTYRRVVDRNGLNGDYGQGERNLIAGDLRRLEKDSLEQDQLGLVAEATGVPMDGVRKVLEEFFSR